MPRNFNLASLGGNKILKDPRVTVRVAIGVLLAANVAMAILAFKPFGGSADDLMRQETARQVELDALNQRIHTTKQTVEKVQSARMATDQFLGKYFMHQETSTSDILDELQRIATESGISAGSDSFQQEEVEGSDSMQMLKMQIGCEGSYQNLAKFVNLLDKSPRFLIIESMHANTVQNGQKVNVSFKIDTFAKDNSKAGL